MGYRDEETVPALKKLTFRKGDKHKNGHIQDIHYFKGYLRVSANTSGPPSFLAVLDQFIFLAVLDQFMSEVKQLISGKVIAHSLIVKRMGWSSNPLSRGIICKMLGGKLLKF